MTESTSPNPSHLGPRLFEPVNLTITEMERAALANLVKRESLRLQRLDDEAEYDELGYRHAARPVLSNLEYKLRAARKPDIGAGRNGSE